MIVPEHQIRNRSDRAAVDAGCWWDEDAAERVCRFTETYIIPTRGFAAEKRVTLLDWQRDFFRELFGWKRADGRRRFRAGCLFIPRQNGKSFIASCLSLYMLVADDEPGAYCVISAVTGEQTRVVFDEVVNSVNRAPERLRRVLKSVPNLREIRYLRRNARLKGLSSEGWGKLGNPPHFAVMDEFCFWKNYKPYTALKTGMDSRRQPLLFAISTSGHDRTSVGYELWQYAESIRNGAIVDPWFYPVVYAAPTDADIQDPAVWKAANPSLGVTVPFEETAAWAARAKVSKTEELQFRQYRLNQWVSSCSQFLNLDLFGACGRSPATWPDLTGKDCYLGVDLSQTRDLTAVVSVTPLDGLIYVEHHSFTSKGAAAHRSSANLVKYEQFAGDGLLTICDGSIIDFEFVRQWIRDHAKKRNVKVVSFDPREATETMLVLAAEGFTVDKYGAYPSYFNPPMRRLEALVNDGLLVHAGDGMILWQAQHLENKPDHLDRYFPARPKANDQAKIDLMVALLIALGKMIVGEAQREAAAAAPMDAGLVFI